MGESSAKHLRGESMEDVIFNGSTARKPVGTASVELVFDNSDGRISGAYAGYNEVSLKRVVSRDGSSNYYINGARAAAATSPSCSWAPAWARAATPSSSRA